MYLIWWRLESPPYLSVWQTAKKNCCSSLMELFVTVPKLKNPRFSKKIHSKTLLCKDTSCTRPALPVQKN
ncbi:unnamed protein product [Nesidiocoris tenuis]|uniref:Uncharacterized protein n=1 Tax=Nesidiocoris tenuis TaxID=355587 RepID=A0A6H5G761_9HEMI|nr:unnamed protein product [Nesidiocoris tenuis]